MAQYWLSWSGFDTYRKCPKKYRLTRVDKEDPPEPDSKHNAVVGSVVQKVYEDFYNDELWRMGPNTSKELLARVDKHFDDFMGEEYVNFQHPKCKFTQTDALNTCRELIPGVLNGIKREKLIGPYAKSEVVLRTQFQSSYFLYGRVDFIIRKPDGEVLVIDGKASKHRDKYVDEDQLLFYAIAFRLKYGTLPDRMGFYYYRYADDPEQAFDWYEPDLVKLRDLRSELLTAFTNIQKRRFQATPKYEHCQWCPWEPVCTERQKEKAIKAEKRRWNRAEKGEEIVPDFADGENEMMIGFGGKTETTN